jgi:hypothetical protein
VAQRSPQQPTMPTNDYDLKTLSGRMAARVLGFEDDDSESLEPHEIAQFLHRWLRRQDAAMQTGLLVAHGLREG